MGGPSLTLTGDASPLREMTKKVRHALGKADMQELLATIGSEIVATTNRRFEAGKDPNGGKWPVSLGARGRKPQDAHQDGAAPGFLHTRGRA